MYILRHVPAAFSLKLYLYKPRILVARPGSSYTKRGVIYAARHPAAGPDEVCLGNVGPETFHKMRWRTKRPATAFDAEGARINDSVAVIIKIWEAVAYGFGVVSHDGETRHGQLL